MNRFLGLDAQRGSDSEHFLRHRRGFAETSFLRQRGRLVADFETRCWTDINRGRLCVFILWMLCASVAAKCQTVGEAAKLPEDQQRAIITGFVDNALKNLVTRTDRNGKTKSAEQYEQDRALANFARAFFTQDATRPKDAPPGLTTTLHLIKKEAAVTPGKNVVDAMGELVDRVFAHFYTDFYTADKKADFAKKADADQVVLFRLNIELYQNDRLYQRVIKQLEDRKSELDAELKKMYDDSIILADGRHVMLSDNGDFMVISEDPNDNSDVKLDEAHRNEAQQLYDCMYENGIANGLKGREVCANPKPKEDSVGVQLLKELAKAAAEQRQQQDQAASAAAAKRQRQAQANSPEGRLQHAREQQAAREQKQKQILAADAAGDPNVKVEAQMIRRDEEVNRQRWAGTRQSPAAFDSRWMGQDVAIVGTVSRVEVDPNGSPNWVTIYFKESPNATFVVCSPYPDLFQERVGLNPSALVGKTLEAAGQVESPYCGGKSPKGSIRVVESKQWQVR